MQPIRTDQAVGDPQPITIPRSLFDMSKKWKATHNMGDLVPCAIWETMPGDIWSVGHICQTRFEPMLWPTMMHAYLTIDLYYIPNRILWTSEGGKAGFMDFIEKPDGDVPHPYWTIPSTYWDTFDINHRVTDSTYDPTSLLEYMGLRQPISITGGPIVAGDRTINPLPIAAYWAIWNNYYRRPQHQPEELVELQQGDNSGLLGNTSFNFPKRRNWNIDYCTGSFAEPQDGDQVLIPLTNTAETGVKGPWQVKKVANDNVSQGNIDQRVAGHTYGQGGGLWSQGDYTGATSGADSYLDIMGTAGTIRALRLAEQMQKFYERLNYVGDRYDQIHLGLFGVNPMKGVINFPVHLSRATAPVIIQDVTATADTVYDDTGNNTLYRSTGDYTGKAIAADRSSSTQFSCDEYGFVMGILNIQPEAEYQDAIQRFWLSRVNKFDYAWSHLAQIGDQAVFNYEVNFNWGTTPVHPLFDEWGYNSRYGEYKTAHSVIAGQLRNNNEGRSKHIARIMDSTQDQLDSNFLYCVPRQEDVFILAAGQHPCNTEIHWQAYVQRALPRYGLPANYFSP